MTQIFVGNLAYDVNENQLRSTFERYGRVSSVRISTDRMSGRARGFAFITMSRLEDADEAIVRLNGSQMSGRALVVNEARGKTQESSPRAENRWHLMVP